MRSTLLGLLLLLPLLAPAADAGVDVQCQPASGSSVVVASRPAILGSKASQQAPCGGGPQALVVRQTGTCGSPSGQRCLGAFPAGWPITCTWDTLPGSSVVALAIGTDADGNGHILDNSPDPKLRVDAPALPPTPITPRSFSYVTPAAGMVIVYPVSALQGGLATDITSVGCI